TIPAPAPEEERVAAYVEELRSAALGPSPFYYEPRAEAPVSEAEAAAPPAPVEAAPLKVSLGAIMAMREGAIALINGQPHREGDAISGDGSDGWRIIAIDSSEGSVTFEHESGRRETRTVRRQ